MTTFLDPDDLPRRARSLLERHAATRPFADELPAPREGGAATGRLTVAVVGRFKAGKSTLLNALLGRQLAAVGATEATATLNVFDHGDNADTFVAHWRDRLPETMPLSELASFTGEPTRARQVTHLGFTASSPILERMRLVDAPGIGSVIDEHDVAARSAFVAPHDVERARRNTQSAIGRADAVIVVLPGTVKETDRGLLDDFGAGTRLPGQGAFNSIAVFQKWETLGGGDQRADPVALAAAGAKKYLQILEGKVAMLTPVSGMLHQIATGGADVGRAIDALAVLADPSRTPDAAFRRLATMGEAQFRGEVRDAPLGAAERAALLDGLRSHLGGGRPERANAWPVVGFALRHARRYGITDGAALREALLALGCIADLERELETRFLRVAGLLKSNVWIERVLEPCERAIVALRAAAARRRTVASDGGDLMRAGDTRRPAALQSWLALAQALVEEDAHSYERTLSELEALVGDARAEVSMLIEDLAHLDALERAGGAVGRGEAAMLRALFGLDGLGHAERLGLPRGAPSDGLLERADGVQEALSRFAAVQTSLVLRRMAAHAELRLSRVFGDILPGQRV